MEIMTLEQFQDAIKAQGKNRIEDVTFRCPKCGEIQSGQDLIEAGAGSSFDEILNTPPPSGGGVFNDLIYIVSELPDIPGWKVKDYWADHDTQIIEFTQR